MKKPIILTFMFTLAAFVCQAQKSNYSFKETYSVSSSPQLKIKNSDGNIKVYPSKSNKIEVYYIARRRNSVLKLSKAELEKEDFIFEISNSNSVVDIRIKERKRGIMSYGNRINISVEIYTPVKTSCDLHSSDGDVELQGLNANHRIRTSDGNLRIANIKGDITGRTSDGNINFKNVSGSLDVTTSDGNVRGNLLELKSELKIRTSDGNIDVRIPKRLGLDLDIHGERLRIPLENFSGRSTEHKISGKINGGGKLVQLRTSDGRISIDM